jgi:outer membrane protein TolC
MKSIVSVFLFSVSLSLSASAVTLEDCIETALKDNPDAQAAAQRVESARAAIREAESAYYPQLTLAGTYGRTDNAGQAMFMALNQRTLNMMAPGFDINNPDDTENLRAGVGAKWRLLDGGQRGLYRDMARLGTDASEAQEEAIRNELVYQVTRGYYGVLQAQAFVKVQEETVASLEENLRVANERFKAGTAVQTDVLNLEVKLAQAREDLIRAQNGAQLAVAAINTAIGQDLVPQGPLAEKERTDLTPPPASQDKDAIEDRPELKAARLNTRIQENAWKKSKRDYFPTVSAFGSVDYDSDVSSDFEQSYFAGAVAEWDFFTGFRRGASTDSAKANYEAAKAQERKARDNLKLDLTQAQLAIKEAWERLDVASRSVASAEESLRITRERYQQGAADITEFLTAQVGLTATRTRNVAAYYDYLTAQANLKRAKGELATETK